jgi:methyl-accepting chemotaxis protein
VTQAIESINSMVSQLNSAHRDQTVGVDRAFSAAKRIGESARQQDDVLHQLATSLQSLRRALEGES